MRSVRIPLNSRKYPNLYAIVDECDADRVRQHRWKPAVREHTIYVDIVGHPSGEERVSLHRFIMGIGPGGPFVDHRNGNGLDNRRSNLRVASNSQNQANRINLRKSSSRFRGVVWNKNVGRWQAQIKVNAKNIYLGLYDDEQEAARAYNRAATEHFGEYARLNSVEEAA